MILEGIVTTQGIDGSLNIAPMGARLIQGLERFRLRPFQTSTTYKNLFDTGVGVFHVTDDVLMISRAAIGIAIDPPSIAAHTVTGRVLAESCRYHEFRVVSQEESTGPTDFLVESVHAGRIRDFLGFNRAKHAVIEAAILATRVNFLPTDMILDEFEKLKVIVEKTGGPDEQEAFALLDRFLENAISTITETGGHLPI